MILTYVPFLYSFKANTASMLSTTVDEETGEERKRMINKMRWKGYGPASIMFADTQVRCHCSFPFFSVFRFWCLDFYLSLCSYSSAHPP